MLLNMKLYRGFKSVLTKDILENKFLLKPRKPVDSGIEFHHIADEWFLKKFNIKARSQTILCSTDIEQAREYAVSGGLAELAPIGNYQLIFSTDVNDFIQHDIDCYNPDEIVDWLENKNYQIVDSEDNIPESHLGEVMLYCASYQVKIIA